MNFDYEDIRKEFENFKEQCNVPFSSQEQEEEVDDLEEDGGFMAQVRKLLLPPAKCGVYLSRLDIKVIGLKLGEDVQVRERKRMIRDIMRAITSKDELKNFFDVVKEEVDSKTKIYDELIAQYPVSKEIFEDKKEKAENFKAKLDEILSEVEEEEI